MDFKYFVQLILTHCTFTIIGYEKYLMTSSDSRKITIPIEARQIRLQNILAVLDFAEVRWGTPCKEVDPPKLMHILLKSSD